MFNQLVLTNNGIDLLSQILAGHVIQFTKIKLGKAASAPSSIVTLTDVVSLAKSLTVARSSVINNNSVNIGANLMGSSITESFDWTEIGIFAKDVTAGGSEVLFSYQYATTPVPIPVGGTVTEMLLDFIISVGDSSSVNITLDESLIFITQADLDSLHSTITGETTTAISAAVTPISNALTSHTGNTSNPHSVTKAQVGLGSVQNYGIATEAEAKAGTATNKYMTPQRSKSVIEGMSILTAGNINLVVGGSQPTPISGKTIIWIDTAS